MRISSRTIACLMLCGLPAMAAEPPPEPEGGWTTSVRSPDEAEVDVLDLILGAPAWVAELALSPLGAVVVAMDAFHLHKRLFDVFTNDARTFGVFPILEPTDRSGLGFGAAVVHNDPLGSPDRLVLLGIVRTNRDAMMSVSFARRILWLGGRTIRLSAAYETESDHEFFGFGPETEKGDNALFGVEEGSFRLGFEILSIGAGRFHVDGTLGYRYRDLRAVPGPGNRDLSSLTLPRGFGRALHYPEAEISFNFDSRDSKGRTGSGVKLSVDGVFTADISGAKTRALKLSTDMQAFFTLAPMNRILMIGGGLAAAIDLGSGQDVPLHQMVTLGGSSVLRGYTSSRFVDRYGWWATIEYRWETFQVYHSGDGVSALLFADIGRVAPEPQELFGAPIAWSAGFGLRVETDLFTLLKFTVAGSSDGVRISLGVGEI